MQKLTLNQISTFIKSELVLIVLGLISVALFTIATFAYFGRGSEPKTPPGTPWKNNIFAGTTTKEELESTLGKPVKTKEESGNLIYLYPSENINRQHEVVIKQDRVETVKEMITSQNKMYLKDFQQKYGLQETKIYGYHGTFAPGHFWGKNGLLVFANEFDGNVVEIWYFKPTTFEKFLSQNPQLKQEKPERF